MCVLLPQMNAFTGLVLLVTSTYGLDSMCDATQNATCYGAVGGPVYLQLMRNARGHDLSMHYGNSVVFRFRKSKSVFVNEVNTPSVLQRRQFVPDNGTMMINPAERRDTGTYRVYIFKDGKGTSVEHTVQLTIEAPVSEVNLSISCSANGEMRVMCSSNGDSPQYSWSLNGRPLNEISSNQCIENPAKTSESSPGCIICLGESMGNLTCSARNNISSASKTQPLPSCTTMTTNSGAPKIDSIYPVLGAVVFLCVSVAAFCICKKKKNTPTTDGQSQDVVYSQCRKNQSSPPGDSYELEYAEVSILKRRKTEERMREDDTVEYGEIRQPGSTNHTPAQAPEPTNHTPPKAPEPTNHTAAEESVYAQVRKGQR